MLVMERKPTPMLVSPNPADLRVDRKDIEFHDLAGGRVRIRVAIRNAGELPSQPEIMRIESAPFGAFVTWRPLAQLVVPVLKPGESRELSIEVPRPRPVPLGGFNRVPPRKLLAALSSPDQPLRPQTGMEALLQFLWRSRRPQEARPATEVSLAPDFWDLLGQGQPQWAGNIDVLVGRHAVERHVANDLRIHPGQTNLAMFTVGNSGRQEAFAFELKGLDSGWNAALYDVTNGNSLVVGRSSAYIDEKQWVESNRGLMIMVATQPPRDCSVGTLEVHVTRRADQKTAIVEFDLNPAAKGPGCFTI
jgi:hypothetical protein